MSSRDTRNVASLMLFGSMSAAKVASMGESGSACVTPQLGLVAITVGIVERDERGDSERSHRFLLPGFTASKIVGFHYNIAGLVISDIADLGYRVYSCR